MANKKILAGVLSQKLIACILPPVGLGRTHDLDVSRSTSPGLDETPR
jgi:hypothetical protein